MAELIDRKEIFFTYERTDNEDYNKGFDDGVLYALDKIDEMPAIEAKPVVHAHWEEQNDGTHFCSRCGNDATYTYEGKELVGFLCPFCGAQMDDHIADVRKKVICGATNLPCSECMPCCENKKESD